MKAHLFLALCAAAALARPGAAQARPQEEPDKETHFFAVPMSRDARELAASIEEHLSAARYGEGINALQRMLEQYRAEVLPDRWRRSREEHTTFVAYPGAGQWALERLLELPPEAKRLYRERLEPHAALALARALEEPERAALLEVVRRWPIAPSALRTWRALGDLELESGRPEVARLAWERARELTSRLGLEPSAQDGVREEWLRARSGTETARERSPVSLPRGKAEPWSTPLDLTPFALGRGNGFSRNNLLPLVYRDRLLVSSSLRLFALDAFTGEVLWEGGPHRGWSVLAPQRAEELYEGIHRDQVMVGAAAGDGVALAVLQTPFSEDENEDWQQIHIMSAIPERRLFAFDLETGRELWNHAPVLRWDGLRWRWDGDGGSFAQRMMVAAPPTVAGSRVLVPCYRMQGRIDYQVACYELETGALLWATPVISGQRERNMFGRSKFEFAATPLVVAGDRVLAQTELGTMAALDLFTGRILWQALYDQIDLPKTTSYNLRPRPQTWRLTPPLVAGELVLSTPSDSLELVAFRLEDGRVPWSYPERTLSKLDPETDHLGFNLLLGADEDTIYLSGGKLAALQKPGGLATSSPFKARWTQPLRDRDTPTLAPRAVLCGDTLLVPGGAERVAYDRRSGDRLSQWSGEWNGGEGGNVWVEDGALFSVSASGASGYFDWHALLERARLSAERATVGAPVRAAAELFLRRGTLALDHGDVDLARECLTQARGFYQRLNGLEARPDAPRPGELDCLRALAEIDARAGRRDEALALLAEARALGPAGKALCELLLQEEDLLRGRDIQRRIAVLAEIEDSCSELPLPRSAWVETLASWLASKPGAETLARDALAALPIGLWVRLERASERARSGELGLALADWNGALELGRGLEFLPGVPVSSLVRERIAELLAQPGGRAAYAPLEQAAAALLAEARGARDPRRLEEVAQRFPHSRAAEEALGERLELALGAGDGAAVAELVDTALETSALTRERETELLLQLARALGRAGNAAFERALLSELARTAPELVSSLPAHGGKTLASLAREAAAEEVAPPPAPVLFDAHVVSVGHDRGGLHEFLGAIPPAAPTQESAPGELHVYGTRSGLVAFSGANPSEPRWQFPLEEPPEPDTTAFARGKLLCADRVGLRCLDERGGELWTRPLAGERVRKLGQWGGVLVANLRSGRVMTFDAEHGFPLWEERLGESGNWSGPVLGDGRAVFFSQLHGLAPRALVLDLFRGRAVAEFPLNGFEPTSPLQDAAWIADGRLLAPAFEHPSRLSAYALADGARAWTWEFGRDEELHSIVTCAGESYPITVPLSAEKTRASPAGPTGPTGNGGIFQLDHGAGTLRRVVPLRDGERPMGIAPETRVELPAPYLFTCTPGEGERGLPLRAIHLPYGILWTWSLPVAAQEVYDGRALPMPAVSSDCVAVAFQTRGGPRDETAIVFLDKRAGKLLDTVLLNAEEFGAARQLELRGLGAALFVGALGPSPRGLHLEILEKMR